MRSINVIKENKDTLTIDQLKLEVSERRDLRYRMVGNLYPSILFDEESIILYIISDKIRRK